MELGNRVTAVLLAIAMVATDAHAQGRGRAGRGGDQPIGKAALLGIEKVATDIGLTDTQKKQFAAMRDELRGERGPRGQAGSFRDMSEEERQAAREQRQKEREERAAKEQEKLASILDATQLERLDQIAVQVQGARALMTPKVQENLGLSEGTIAELRDTAREVGEDLRSKMGELFRSGDRDSIREKVAQLRADSEKKILSVLSESERAAFAEMKGEDLGLTFDDLRALGERGGRGERGGGERPTRGSRPDLE